MAYSITNKDGTVLTAGGSTVGQRLGSIVEESVDVAANLLVFPLPFSDSEDTDVQDFGGVVNNIVISGVISGATADLDADLVAIKGLVNGDQSSDNSYPLTYVSDMLGTIQVKIHGVNFRYVMGTPTRLEYSIKMVQSSENG